LLDDDEELPTLDEMLLSFHPQRTVPEEREDISIGDTGNDVDCLTDNEGNSPISNLDIELIHRGIDTSS